MKDSLPIKQSQDQVQVFYDDEISIHDIFLVIIKKRKLIVIVAAISTLLAVMLSLVLPPVYQAKADFLPPTTMDITKLKIATFPIDSTFHSKLTQDSLYHDFQTQLTSISLKKKIFKEMKLGKDLVDNGNENEAMNKYFTNYKVSRSKENKSEESVRTMQLSLTGSNPRQISDVLNAIIHHANKTAVLNVVSEIKELINSKILILEKEIRDLKTSSTNLTDDEIIRLGEQDDITRNKIHERVNVLRKIAKLKKEDRIQQLEEASVIADKVGIFDYYSLKDAELKIEVLNQPKPLFYRGVKALRAEITELKNRKSDDPFIPGLRDLQQQLELLKQNQKIKALLARRNNDAFIESLRAKETELAKLKTIDVDTTTNNVNAVTIDQLAFPPTKKIKPKRSSIVIMGLLLGLMLGIFLAFIVNYFNEHPIKGEL